MFLNFENSQVIQKLFTSIDLGVGIYFWIYIFMKTNNNLKQNLIQLKNNEITLNKYYENVFINCSKFFIYTTICILITVVIWAFIIVFFN